MTEPIWNQQIFIHPCCVCGEWGTFGYDVSMQHNKLGTWYCMSHRPLPKPKKEAMTLFEDMPEPPPREPALSLETIVERVFVTYGVQAANYHRELEYDGGMFKRTGKLLIRDAKIKGRFLYKDYDSGLSVPIECHQQNTSGSTDTKLAYALDLLVECGCPGYWLVLSGRGFSKNVIENTRRKIARLHSERKVCGHLVFNEGDFLRLAVEGLVERGEI